MNSFLATTSSKKDLGFQADFGAFPSNSETQKSFSHTLSSKRGTIHSQLVSLHAGFQDVFVTLHNKVEDLCHLQVVGAENVST